MKARATPAKSPAPRESSAGADRAQTPLENLQRGLGNRALARLLGDAGRAYGADLSDVPIHADGRAAALGAEAYASAEAIHLARGADPGSPGGRALLFHELAHVVQLRRGGTATTGALEREADRAAEQAARGEKTELSGAPARAVLFKKRPAAVAFGIKRHGSELFDDDDRKIGFYVDGAWYVSVDRLGAVVPIAPSSQTPLQAQLGLFEFSPGDAAAYRPIVRMREVDVSTLYGLPLGSATLKPSGRSIGVLTDESGRFSAKVATLKSMALGTKQSKEPTWVPVDEPKLPSFDPSGQLLTPNETVDDTSRIVFTDEHEPRGRHVWVSLPLGGDPGWASATHPIGDITARRREIVAELPQLAPAERRRVEPYTDTMAAVSAIEGSFGSGADSTSDRSTSFGIFQWAMAKDESADQAGARHAAERENQAAVANGRQPPHAVDGANVALEGTFRDFFVDLRRDAASSTVAAAALSELQAAGYDVHEGEVYSLPNGRLVTHRSLKIYRQGVAVAAGQAVRELRAHFRAGALRSYQLLAAHEWIGRIEGKVVRPGGYARLLGVPLTEESAGRIRLESRGRTMTLAAANPQTIANVLARGKPLAQAVQLGVNRPEYPVPVVWRALQPERDDAELAARIRRQIDVTFDELDAIRARLPQGGARAYDPALVAEARAAGLGELAHRAEGCLARLQATLWPNASDDAYVFPGGDSPAKLVPRDEVHLLARLRVAGVDYYRAHSQLDDEAWYRRGRFATVEQLDLIPTEP